MKRMITIAFMMTVVVMMAHAQGALKRVYNETIDPMTQIDEGLQKAKAEGKKKTEKNSRRKGWLF